MLTSVDPYLGAFLIVAGFALSLLNLKRLIKGSDSLSAVLLSQNVLLMCIGIGFIMRSLYDMKTVTSNMEDIELRIADMHVTVETMDCNFVMVLKSYGPFIVSLVNSFLSLVIDNYMHYQMLQDIKQEDDENTVQDLRSFQGNRSVLSISRLIIIFKKFFPYIAIVSQWVVPVLITLLMYPMEVKEKMLLSDEVHRSSNTCMTMVDVSNETCTIASNSSLELRKLFPSYLEVRENNFYNDTIINNIDLVVDNVQRVLSDWKNENYGNISKAPLRRKPRLSTDCMKVCYVENNSLLLYMFIIAVGSYFIPITISTVILTKIHMMDVKRSGMKIFVSRELLYNVLFWTPVMFDTFLSLLLCSYSMDGMRTSIFNVIANVYQAVKNFMNTKYFKENSVAPIMA